MKTHPIAARTVRSFALLTLLFCFGALSAFTQDPGRRTPEERAKRITEMMKEELKLSGAQEGKVYNVNLKYAQKNEALRAIPDTAQRRKTAEATDKAKDGELKAILTADQFKSYLKLKEEMKARRRQGGSPGRQ